MKASQGIARVIRLKEFNPGLVRRITPENAYLAKTDGTLLPHQALLRADNNGFLITGNELSGQRQKIIILGDSFVESYWVPSEKTRWVSVAERYFERLRPGEFSFHNGGYSGATSLHMAIQIPTKIRPLFDDVAGVILVVPTNNDASVANKPHTYWSKNKYNSPIEPFDHSGDLPQIPFDPIQDTQATWSMMLRYLATYKIPTLVVAPPYRTGKWGEDSFITKLHKSAESFEIWKDQRNSAIDIALATAKDLGVPVFDTRMLIGDAMGNSMWFYDQLHLNAQGQEHFGKFFARELMRKRFWEKTPALLSQQESLAKVRVNKVVTLLIKAAKNPYKATSVLYGYTQK